MATPKRPLLTTEDRARLRKLATKAESIGEKSGTDRAYCQGVADVLKWLDNAEPSPMLKQLLG